MQADYVLTNFAPTMFGSRASIHLKMVDQAEAESLVGERTEIVASRVSHEHLARNVFPRASKGLTRYAQFSPGKVAVILSYRGPPVGLDGSIPANGHVSYFVIEVSEYLEVEPT